MTALSRRLAHALDFRRVDPRRVLLVQRTLPSQGHRPVSDPLPEILNVRLVRRVHPGLVLDVALKLGRETASYLGPPEPAKRPC